MTTERLRFLPPDNRTKYRNEVFHLNLNSLLRYGLNVVQDYKVLCAQQPIPLNDIEDYLILGTERMKPPTFWCGWLLNIDAMFDVIKSICPDAVRYTGLIHVPEKRHADKLATVLSKTLSRRLAKYIGLDEKWAYLLRVVEVARSDGEIGIALTVACNHDQGFIGQEYVDKVSNLFANGEAPKWHIDPYEWEWEIRGV